jgi:hypothetical protein
MSAGAKWEVGRRDKRMGFEPDGGIDEGIVGKYKVLMVCHGYS